MKFSYSYLKKFVPAIKSAADLCEKLTMGLFEIDGREGDTLDIKVLPNRYSDAASHLGLAREISAFYGRKFVEPRIKIFKPRAKQKISVTVKDRLQCRRACAWYFEGIVIGQSPNWMQEILIACGMRPINNLVDITNFVMLQSGQPLHAFDLDLMDSGDLFIRRATASEKLITLDNREFRLDPEVLVLADRKDALDIAGIKGGKKAEVSETTTRIMLTACSFDGISIYKTQRKINLMTEASLRFSHHLSPELAEVGIRRAAELIVELCKGVPGQMVDVRTEKPTRRFVRLDEARINRLLGTKISRAAMISTLGRTGFAIDKSGLLSVPALRTDVTTIEDVAEEVARFYGYEKIEPSPLQSLLAPKMSETGNFEFCDLVRDALVGYGFDEVYNYSFVDKIGSAEKSYWPGEAYEVLNPISEEQTHLRTTQVPHIRRALTNNLKSFDQVKLFEIGRTYHRLASDKTRIHEVQTLAFAVARKRGETVFELKGVTDDLLKRFGFTDVAYVELARGLSPANQSVRVMVNQKAAGYVGALREDMSVAELDLTLLKNELSEELAYKPIPRFPAIIRDISLLVDTSARIGRIMEAIETSNSKMISDVDFVGEYQDPSWRDKQSLTFRIVFQSEERTLTNEEVDAEMKGIAGMLRTAFNAEVR